VSDFQERNKRLYGHSFYQSRKKATYYSAKLISTFLKELGITPRAVIDIGCGVGAWLEAIDQVFPQCSLLGIDGEWVPKQFISPNIDFHEMELSVTGVEFFPDSEFDLALCLEVLEHLSDDRVDQILDFLGKNVSYAVVSVAPPGQGGVGHVNEMPLSELKERMGCRGFRCIDIIRPKIWNDQNVPYWYRQNCVLFVKQGLSISHSHSDWGGFDLIHPETLNEKVVPSLTYAKKHLVGWLRMKAGLLGR